jgi:hypothetical protein
MQMKLSRLKFFLLAFMLLALANQCFSQQVIAHAFMENKKAHLNSDTIYYDFNRNLTWDDFKGKPVLNSPAGAVTASGFAFDAQIKSDGRNIYLNLGVYTFFTKDDSWKKPGINSAYHLMHEQHHFDITRISAEKFLNELTKAHFTKDNYNALLNSLFDKVYTENTKEQDAYDDETQHSLDVNKQNEWNIKIAARIQALKGNLVSGQ